MLMFLLRLYCVGCFLQKTRVYLIIGIGQSCRLSSLHYLTQTYYCRLIDITTTTISLSFNIKSVRTSCLARHGNTGNHILLQHLSISHFLDDYHDNNLSLIIRFTHINTLERFPFLTSGRVTLPFLISSIPQIPHPLTESIKLL